MKGKGAGGDIGKQSVPSSKQQKKRGWCGGNNRAEIKRKEIDNWRAGQV